MYLNSLTKQLLLVCYTSERGGHLLWRELSFQIHTYNLSMAIVCAFVYTSTLLCSCYHGPMQFNYQKRVISRNMKCVPMPKNVS